MGNFSISHYAAITLAAAELELRYLIDMAEIPTFQELQDGGIAAAAGHPGLDAYLARKAEVLKEGLHLEVNGGRLALTPAARDILFSEGAGGLPTMKLGFVYRASLDAPTVPGWLHLHYRDENFADRAGWREVVASARPGVALASTSVPEQDRSRQLSDYPTDMLNSPPQLLEARLVFRVEPPAMIARTTSPAPPSEGATSQGTKRESAAPVALERSADAPQLAPAMLATPAVEPVELSLQPNRQAVRRDTFTELIGVRQTGLGVFLFAALVAAALGAFHALEPGHGKTVVAAYLVGSRGTAWHAMLLGLIVTASHTAGVYLLGAVTLYASRYVVPERLYPWLGVISGLTIAGLGFVLFLRRYAGAEPHLHDHGLHDHGHGHGGPHHAHDHHPHHHHHVPAHGGDVSLRELFALGITGGIVPCPAALVVLLSAVALRRVGFGLFLIVAFSVGLAAVLIAIGILMVYAARLMARFRVDSPLITRWLPLTSSAVISILGLAIAFQALLSAGIVQVRLG
jgi:ABC-type nickel/cobalt efflux system permease component RcnA